MTFRLATATLACLVATASAVALAGMPPEDFYPSAPPTPTQQPPPNPTARLHQCVPPPTLAVGNVEFSCEGHVWSCQGEDLPAPRGIDIASYDCVLSGADATLTRRLVAQSRPNGQTPVVVFDTGPSEDDYSFDGPLGAMVLGTTVLINYRQGYLKVAVLGAVSGDPQLRVLFVANEAVEIPLLMNNIAWGGGLPDLATCMYTWRWEHGANRYVPTPIRGRSARRCFPGNRP